MVELPEREEFNRIALEARRGDTGANVQLVRIMRPYVEGFLRRHIDPEHERYSWDQREEMEQAAWVGVYHALQKFDETKGTKFSSYAYFWMRHEVMDWIAQNSGSLPMPRSAWHFASLLDEALYDVDPAVHPNEAPDDVLASLEINVSGQAGSVPSAGSIFRARQTAHPLDPERDGSHSGSPEDELFSLETLERKVLLFVDSLDLVEEEERYQLAEQFAAEEDLPEGAAQWLVEASL